jgi:hypothetical protein
MALLHFPLDQIEEAQLQNLIKGQAVKTRDIEYKRETYGNKDSDAGEFLADVSSFANTSGGDIIIGTAVKSGVPTNIVPIPVGAADSEKLRLENIARSGLQHRIFGLDFRAVPVTGGGGHRHPHCAKLQQSSSACAPRTRPASLLCQLFSRKV